MKKLYSIYKNLSPYERNIRLAYLYNLFIKMFFSLPVEVIFFAEIAGNYTKAMSVYAIAYAVGTITSIPIGIIGDMTGRKTVAVMAASCRLISIIFYALATDYSFLIYGSLFAGITRGAGTAIIDSIVFESLKRLDKPDLTHEVMSKLKTLANTSLGIGALLSGLFVLISVRATFIATIVPISIALLCAISFTETKKASAQKITNPFKHFFGAFVFLKGHKNVSRYMIADSLHFALNDATFSFGANFYKQILPLWAMGIFRFSGYVANAVNNYYSSAFAKKFGLQKSIAYTAMADNFLCMASGCFSNLLAPVLKTTASGVCGLYTPASCTYMQQIISEKERTTLLSIFSMCICIFYTLGTTLIGWVADNTSPASAVIIGYGLALASNPLYFWAFSKSAQPNNDNQL